MTPTKKRAPRKPKSFHGTGYFYAGFLDDKDGIYIGGTDFSDYPQQAQLRKDQAKHLHKWLGQYIAWAEWKERK